LLVGEEEEEEEEERQKLNRTGTPDVKCHGGVIWHRSMLIRDSLCPIFGAVLLVRIFIRRKSSLYVPITGGYISSIV